MTIRFNVSQQHCAIEDPMYCNGEEVHLFVDPYDEEINDSVEYRLGCSGCREAAYDAI